MFRPEDTPTRENLPAPVLLPGWGCTPTYQVYRVAQDSNRNFSKLAQNVDMPQRRQDALQQETCKGFSGRDQQRELDTPAAAKTTWLRITGYPEIGQSRSSGRDQYPPDFSAVPATGDAGGIDRGCSTGGTNTEEYSETDVELDRLWKRLNLLNGEVIPAAIASPPSVERISVSSSGPIRRGNGNGRANSSDIFDQSYDREHETRVHQNDIAGKLEQIQQALAAKGIDGTHKQEELEALYTRVKELETYVEEEASKRLEAESRAENLEAGMHVMADRWDLEIAAREAAESNANRCMELIAEARVAWQKTQTIVENKERELAAAEQKVVREAGDSLERRLEDARKAKELERQHSVALRLALEGSFAAKRASSPLAAATAAPSAKAGHSGGVGNTVKHRGKTERRAVGAMKPLSKPHAPSTKDGRVAAAEARLEAAIEMAATAATSKRINGAALQRQKARLEHVEKQGQRHGYHAMASSPPDSSRFDRSGLEGGDIRRGLEATNASATASNAIDGARAKLKQGGNPKEGSAVTSPFSAGDGCSGTEGKEKLGDCNEGVREEDTWRRGTMAKLKGKVGSAVKVMNEARNLQVHDSKVRTAEISVSLCR